MNGKKMNYVLLLFGTIFVLIHTARCFECHVECPLEEEVVCGFDPSGVNYMTFPSKCAMRAYSICTNVDFQSVPLQFCVKSQMSVSRRMYGESCPVFCPNHYRPVCGVSKYRDYLYRSFTNGCYLDMINCRGDDDYTGYVEVPLHYCQRHAMKNIFKEKLVVSNIYDTRDYG